MMKKRFTVTAALPYANGPLHIGHIAGAYLPADTYVRYLKLKGHDVAFICGSDEHGAAITLRAKKEGVKPQAIIDRYHTINTEAFEKFGIDFSIFHRTSSELHKETAQAFFKELQSKDALVTRKSKQLYDEEYNQFLADRYVIGTCPKCDYEEAYGDQCERCGSSLSPDQLIDPKSTLSGNKPILKETEHWYLPMGDHETWLREWLVEGTLDGKPHHNANAWRNAVLGQCKSWIDGGLQDRAMTRDLDWGVPVPVEGADGKVLYVWLDAPIGYISATKEWASQHGKDWKTYWQDEDTELIHFIGKDNIVFHCIIFPIILKTHGSYNLPVNVPANEFLNLEGQKISTSRNWAVWLHEYMEDFPERADELRYVLTSIAPETKDSEFTWGDYQARVNNELVAIFGNFVNRAMVLTHKYFDGALPAYDAKAVSDEYKIDEKQVAEIIADFDNQLASFRFKDALTTAVKLARLGNKFLADTEPWKLYKTGDEAAVAAILHQSIQLCVQLGLVFQPILPDTSRRLMKMLNVQDESWSKLGDLSVLEGGHQLSKAALLFTKVSDEEVEAQLEKLNSKKEVKAMESVPEIEEKAHIQFEDFLKMDLRVGTITQAEPVKKADKLLKLTVDLGSETRTIVSGIAEHYTIEEVTGRQVSVLCNLPPRKLRGVVSEGMILMAEDAKGKLTFVSPNEKISSGSTIR